METKLKLNDITTEYSKFNANQVLTETQLNAFIDYFDDQDRLSRIGLIGVGIVCGFEITALYNAERTAASSITISQGAGVTTDGDYVQFFDLVAENLASKTFKYYKKFEDDNAQYDRFLNSQGNTFDLWELYTEETDDNTSLIEFPNNIQDMAVVLYLEQYPKEDELCNKLTCDNQGTEQINNLKVLLIAADDLRSTLSKDTIYTNNNWFDLYEDLGFAAVSRDIIKLSDYATETDFNQLKKIYTSILEDTNLKTTLKTDLNTILNKSGKSNLPSNFDTLFSITKNNILEDFQYRYDLLKDIVATYNEIKELLLTINFHCCPNIGSFPKHLMLGSLNVNDAVHELRHQFYESAVIGESKENWWKLQSLLDRVVGLIVNYKSLTTADTIKITPSVLIDKLGNKAIPAYYNVTNNFLTSWNFNKTQIFKQNTNLSYNTENLLEHPAIKDPLQYSIDNFNFFRIEGIHGKNFRSALEEVIKQRDAYGLNFDVKVLKLSQYNTTLNLNEYESMFRDLQFSLLLWQKDLSCTLSLATTLLSSFSLDDVGGNVTVVPAASEVVASAASELTAESGLTAITTDRIGSRTAYNTLLDKYSNTTYTKSLFLEDAYYMVDNTKDIEDSISKETATIGEIFSEILSENRSLSSAAEIKSALEDRISPIVDTDDWNLDLDVKDIAINQPIELLANIYALSLKIPSTLVDLSEAQVNAFNESLEKICALNDQYKAKYDTADISDDLKKDIAILITHLSAICCSGEKLDIVVNELNSRKAVILNQLQFKEYIKLHPGTRHLAGVPDGGTFIMAYLEEQESGQSAYEPSQITFTFLEQPNIDDDGLDGDEGRIQLWNDFLSTNFAFIPRYDPDITQNPIDEIVLIGSELTQTVENFVNFLNLKWKRAGADDIISATVNPQDGITVTITITDQKVDEGENFIYFHNPEIIGVAGKTFFEANEEVDTQIIGGNTVVADFALPYRCCDNGTSVNFIIPKEPTFLSLPISHVCLQDDITLDPFEFTVNPTDGEILAVVPNGVNAGVFIDENDGKTKLDVHQIDESLLGTTIQFTVNEEPTDCQIVVYPEVHLSITVEEPIQYNDNKTEAEVTFTINWDDPDFATSNFANQITYTWDFLGNGTTIALVPDDNQFVRTYNLPINETNIATPNLQIALGPCAKEIPVAAIVFDTFIPSQLAIAATHCFDPNLETDEVQFTDNLLGDITIEGGDIDGLEIQGDTLVITGGAFQAFDQEIRFLENDQETNAVITIHEVKEISITEGTGDSYFWNNGALIYRADFQPNLPDGTDTSGLTYQWSASDGQTGDDQFFAPEFELNESGANEFTIQLEITDQNGCIAQAEEFSKQITYPDFTMEVADTTLCLNDPSSTQITVDPILPGTLVTGNNGVEFNSNLGVWEFVPANSGLTSAGPVTINLAGTSESATINLIDDNVSASFTDVIDQEKQILVLTSTSVGADSIEWIVTLEGGTKLDVEQEEVVEINLADFEANSFNVQLIASNTCGSDSTERTVSVVNCIEGSSQIITTDNGNLSEFLVDNITQETHPSIIALASGTNSIYESVMRAFENSLNGTNNETLFSKEQEVLSIPNLLITANALIEAGLDKDVLNVLYIAQVRLFFNIIHCQLPGIWEGDFAEIVNEIMENLRMDVLSEDELFVQFMLDYQKNLNPEDDKINEFVNQLINS